MFSLLELLPESTLFNIIDVGASFNPGEPAPYQGFVDAGKARVIGFEPDLAECERLNQTFGSPHRFLPHFVGDGGPATFYETNWVLTGSLFPANTALLEKFQNLAEVVTPVAEHPVETSRLDDLQEIADVDYLKIDVQGAELAVFRGAPRLLAETLVICTEVEFVELYKGQPLFADVDAFLRQSGFQFHRFDGFASRAFKPLIYNNDINAGGGQILWSDAIYVRDWMRLDELSADKLLKYAVLAHDLLHSYDLAHLVLSALDCKAGSELADLYLGRLTNQ
ncbi:FkbM family methyltransferase [Dechloromonas denitrificans]|uniref:FkbM family methyltransferase n=1 Tax=Dechloromonas denitrificans TaxID=281362 RepID=UPI001CF84A01|nr:FkbM family methyltransferase [Dechloromonas denitrificans]UCV04573.1 FkbM family methyltransferase [Dechloromonas denitrificans]